VGRGRRDRPASEILRGLAVDITPLRRSRDYRLLWFGQLISTTGRAITLVALPFQVFQLTDSALAVGLIGLVELIPLILFSVVGGAIAERMDRRKLLLATEAGLAGTSALLLAGAVHGDPALWYLYLAAGLQASVMAVNQPTRAAIVPKLVGRDLLPAAMALSQVLFSTTMIVGPALGGLILGRFGLAWAYAADVISFGASILAAALIRPLPPHRGEELITTGWQDVKEGFAYLRRRRILISTFIIDLDAMIFGMPRALFPVLAAEVFHVGPQGLGLLYAAPALGALIGAVTAGWVGQVQRQGRAVIWAVVVWGTAIVGFGLSGNHFWLALALLAVAGAADVISAVFRGTILQVSTPDELRGRISAVHIMVVTGGPRLGDVEAGVVAAVVSPVFSVVSGGALCVAGAFVVGKLFPELRRYHANEEPGSDLPDGDPMTAGGGGRAADGPATEGPELSPGWRKIDPPSGLPD
jgi:MFS family permease